MPCPDVGSAAVILMLFHFEIVEAKQTVGLSGKNGFEIEVAESELADIVNHYGPIPKVLGENGMPKFDDVFSRDHHLQRFEKATMKK